MGMHETTIRINDDHMPQLRSLIQHMQAQDNNMTIEDCIDALFAIGMIAASAAYAATGREVAP